MKMGGYEAKGMHTTVVEVWPWVFNEVGGYEVISTIYSVYIHPYPPYILVYSHV